MGNIDYYLIYKGEYLCGSFLPLQSSNKMVWLTVDNILELSMVWQYVILWFIKIYIFDLPLFSGTGLPKPLKFLMWWECYRCFLMLVRWLSKCPLITQGWGLVTRGTILVIRYLQLSVLAPSPQRRGEGLKVESVTTGQWFNESCPCHEASIKPPKNSTWRTSGLVSIRRFRGNSPHESSMPFLCSWVTSFYNKQVI